MKLYLFGGAEIGLPSRSVKILKKLIKKTFIQLRPENILYIPFARTHSVPSDKGEWDDGWFNLLMKGSAINIVDVRKPFDRNRLHKYSVFIGGGPERNNLIDQIVRNQTLYELITAAENVVAESSGSMAMGEYMRTSRTDSSMIKALNILKSTVIEPHYTERNYKEYLPEDLKKSGVKYGIGIDSATGIVVNPQNFPHKWHKIGEGNVFILKSD